MLIAPYGIHCSNRASLPHDRQRGRAWRHHPLNPKERGQWAINQSPTVDIGGGL
jgi:hypothetical protein